MNTEKKKILEYLERIYEFGDRQAVKWVAFGMLLICVIMDMCPLPYFFDFLEEIFTYAIGNLIAIIVVVWTFTVSLGTYFLQKTENRYYGIRMIDVLLYDMKLHGIMLVVEIVFMELVVLIIAAVGEWPITLVFVAIQHLFVMVYVFATMIIKTSYNNVCEQIGAEIRDVLRSHSEELSRQITGRRKEYSHLMLFRMIRNMNYADDAEREILYRILRDNVFREMTESLDSEMISYQIVADILQTEKNTDILVELLCEWFASDMKILHVKRGAIRALLENLTPEKDKLCDRMISVEQDYQRELQVWRAIYNLFWQGYEGESWRRVYTDKEFDMLYVGWSDKDRKMAAEIWGQLQKEASESKSERGLCECDCLFDYIFFENEGGYEG